MKTFISLIHDKVIVKKSQIKKFEFCLNEFILKKHLSDKGFRRIMDYWSAPETEANSR